MKRPQSHRFTPATTPFPPPIAQRRTPLPIFRHTAPSHLPNTNHKPKRPLQPPLASHREISFCLPAPLAPHRSHTVHDGPSPMGGLRISASKQKEISLWD